MKLERLRYTLKEGLKWKFWKSLFMYMRGIVRIANGKYQKAIYDFAWIINNEGILPLESLCYKNLGICYAYVMDFNKAEEYLTKVLRYDDMQDDGELYQWLGYIYFVREKYDDSIDCFKRAHSLGQKGMDKWLVDHEYVKENLLKLNKIIKEKYKGILPDL